MRAFFEFTQTLFRFGRLVIMGIQEKIREIEAEMARTQKNKATESHMGMLKGRIAKLKSELLNEADASAGGAGTGFEARKSGDARVTLVGFPSVGKSTLLSEVTNTKSETGDFEYTTLTCIPGIIPYKGSKIQLLDLPGIIEGASKGIGRGKQVIAVARTADLVCMMLDASKGSVHKRLLEKELESVGIRLNKKPPNIYLKRKTSGGVAYNSVVKQTKGLTEKLVKNILKMSKIHNADVVIHEDVTVDEFIDVLEGNRQYIPCVYVYNKIDTISIEEVDQLARQPHSTVISCAWKLNLDELVDKFWEELNLIRIYTKKRGVNPDLEEPVVLRRGSTIGQLCSSIHKGIRENFKYAYVWGTSAKHEKMKAGVNHVLEDEDVVEIVHNFV